MMALPDLPAKGESPWYDKRQAFDVAVKTELEGRLSEAQLSTTIVDAAESVGKMATVGVGFSRFPGLLRGTRRFNASAFTQDPIQTMADGTQFAVWVAADSHAIVGKRKPGGEWETFDLTGLAGNPLGLPVSDDSHNSFSMVVDGDGFLHVSGNHHLTPLRYVRSANPLDITSWVTPGMIGDSPESTMTYPQFAKLPDGNLIFTFRDEGATGLGAYYMNYYNVATKTWTRRGKLLDGTTVTPYQSPYLNKLAIGADGTIHLFFLWREGASNDPRGATQISHMQSFDAGVTWKTAAGASLTLPVLYSDTAPVITQTLVGELNQSGAAVDSNGYPWSVWWRSLGSLNGGWGIYVRRWDGAAWVQEYLLNTGDRRWSGVDISLYPRPQLFTWQSRMFLLYVRETDAAGIRLREVTPGAANPFPDTVIYSGALGRYEPVFDLAAVASTGRLHVMVTPTQEGTVAANPSYASVWGGVLTVDLATIVPRPAPRETVFISPPQMVPAASPAVGTIEVVNATPVAKVVDDAQTTEFVTQVQIPVGWGSFRMKVLWMPLAATPSGNLMLRSSIRWNIPGELAGTGESIQFGALVAAGAQYKVVESPFDMVINRPPGDSWLLTLTLNRWGGQTGDTLTGGVAILGIVLTRSS